MQFKPSNDSQEVDVNLTPLIDVVFLLLIFFMVSTTFDSTSQLKINLPEADAAQQKNELKQLKISINTKGVYYLNGRALRQTSPAALRSAIERQLEHGNKDIQVIIQPDAAAPVQSMVTAMNVVGQMGLSHVSIQTIQPAAQ